MQYKIKCDYLVYYGARWYYAEGNFAKEIVTLGITKPKACWYNECDYDVRYAKWLVSTAEWLEK